MRDRNYFQSKRKVIVKIKMTIDLGMLLLISAVMNVNFCPFRQYPRVEIEIYPLDPNNVGCSQSIKPKLNWLLFSTQEVQIIKSSISSVDCNVFAPSEYGYISQEIYFLLVVLYRNQTKPCVLKQRAFKGRLTTCT